MPRRDHLGGRRWGNGSRTAQFLWIFWTPPSLTSSCKMACPLGYTFCRLPSWGVTGGLVLGESDLWVPEHFPWQFWLLVSEQRSRSFFQVSKIIPFRSRHGSLLCVWLGKERGKCAHKVAGTYFHLSRSVFHHFWAHGARLNVPTEPQGGLCDGGGGATCSALVEHCTDQQRCSHRPWGRKWLLQEWLAVEKGRSKTKCVVGWGVPSLRSWKTNQNSAAVFFQSFLSLSLSVSLNSFLFSAKDWTWRETIVFSRSSRQLPGEMTREEQE